ncbi:ABC transporter permease [bacterium]|nr:ABC transporter permease [bacterium]
MIPVRQYLLLILQKASSDLVAEVRQGYLGIIWWVLEPVLYLSVFYFLFVIVFDRGGSDAVAFLLIGLVIWKWFGSSIPKCSNCISTNNGLIRQIYLPKLILPVMTVVTATIKFLIVFFLLLIFLLALGYEANLTWFSLPLLVFVQFLFTLAVGSILAAIIPFLPDLRVIIDNAMMLLFFLSGIFFDFSSVSLEAQRLLHLNPMLGLIESYRSVLVSGVWPDWHIVGYILIMSVVFLIIGWYLLHRYDRVYPKIV